MNIQSLTFMNVAGRIAVIAALLLAACAPFGRSAPQQVKANNPTVSYKYRNDDELIQTNQLAETFCLQYQLAPRSLGFTRDQAGNSLVNFECVPTLDPAVSAVDPNLTYTYRTDQQLLDVSRSANNYCLDHGSSRVTSDVVSNANGTKTITFQCNPG
jgi:hypothetical protein